MQLFISYSHTDLWQVRQVVEILQNAGHEPWFNDRLLPGQDWRQKLSAEIQKADTFVYMLSPESVADEWCQWELKEAILHHKPIIPILIQADTAIPNVLARHQYADFSGGPTPENIARFMGGLTQIAVTLPREAAPHVSDHPEGVPARVETSKHVFISYSRDDKSLMGQFRDALRAAKIAVWTDEKIPIGSNLWKDAIEKAIENAHCILVLLSPEAKQSIWVKRELDYADAHKIPVVPVLIDGDEATAVPFGLIGSQYINFVNQQFSLGLEDVLAELRRLLDLPQNNGAGEQTGGFKPPRHGQPDDSFWDTLFKRLNKERCTPFIGMGLAQGAFMPQAEMARKWAQQHNYPFKEQNYDLARVAQFLSFELNAFDAKDEIIENWLNTTKQPDYNSPYEPHSVLAQLPCPIYINTNYDDFLFRALRHHGKDPCRVYWYDNQWVFSENVSRVTSQTPIVFHLYGHQEEAESMILTDDDYLQYLVDISRGIIELPTEFMNAIGRSSYLFMGFSAADWSLRTLLHLLSNYDRKGIEPHIAIQIEPVRHVDSEAQTERVIKYLRRYFNHQLKVHVDVYLSDANNFIEELARRWEAQL